MRTGDRVRSARRKKLIVMGGRRGAEYPRRCNPKAASGICSSCLQGCLRGYSGRIAPLVTGAGGTDHA